jgi:hypothetical protein
VAFEPPLSSQCRPRASFPNPKIISAEQITLHNTHPQEHSTNPSTAEVSGSSSVYSAAIPDGWLSWIAENRVDGLAEDQIIAIVTSAGFDRTAVTATLEAMRSNPCYVVADRMAQRFKKLKSLLGIRKSLAGLCDDAGSVERRSRISRHEFLERYYAANKPVILTGLLAGSSASQRWTPEYLGEICGEAAIQIMRGRDADPRYEVNSEAHKHESKLSDYVRMVLSGGPSNDYYLVANNGFFNRPETQALLDEAPALADYLDPSDRNGKVYFWFGPAGSITPLHHDLMNILVAEVYGRKRFILIPPEETVYVYNGVGVYSDVDCKDPDYSRHPLYEYASPISVVLEPGDVLFIPVGWWHHVEALDTSIMLSYVNFRFPNYYEWFHPNTW